MPLALHPSPLATYCRWDMQMLGHKSGELIQPLMDCSTQESGPGNQSRADLIDGGAGSPPQQMLVGDLALLGSLTLEFACFRTVSFA